MATIEKVPAEFELRLTMTAREARALRDTLGVLSNAHSVTRIFNLLDGATSGVSPVVERCDNRDYTPQFREKSV